MDQAPPNTNTDLARAAQRLHQRIDALRTKPWPAGTDLTDLEALLKQVPDAARRRDTASLRSIFDEITKLASRTRFGNLNVDEHAADNPEWARLRFNIALNSLLPLYQTPPPPPPAGTEPPPPMPPGPVPPQPEPKRGWFGRKK